MGPPQFVRFCDLTAEHVNRDLQVHTAYTDGGATAEEIIRRAEEMRLKEIAFTEHVRRSSDFFPRFATEVRELRGRTTVGIYVGIEVKTEDEQGTLDVHPAVFEQAEIVLGSVHRFPIGDGRFISAREFGYEEAAAREFRLALGLLRHAPIHVLSHPGGMCNRTFGRFPEKFLEELMRASLERGIAIEINTSYYPRNLDAFLDLCRRVNPYVSVGSDVHQLSELGTCREALKARGVGCA